MNFRRKINKAIISITFLFIAIFFIYSPAFAGFITTATKDTNVGSPQLGSSGGNSNAVSVAQNIVDTLKDPKYKCAIVSQSAYGGYLAGYAFITRDDVPCVPDTFPNGSSVDLTYGIKVEGQYALQCVNFVRAVAHAIGKPFDKNGNAFDFASNPPAPYKFYSIRSSTPQPGDIAIWSDAGANPGHIGIIAAVNGTFPSGSLVILEGNGKGNGEVDRANYPLNSSSYYGLNLEGWLRLK